MTILGFSIAPGGQRASVWSDTEIYHKKSACGHALKLFGNPAIVAVAAASGPLPLIRRVGRLAHSAMTLDELLETIRADLKRSFEPDHSLALAARAPTSSASVVAVGWSERFGRFVGYVMHREVGFAPHAAVQFTSPEIADFDGSADVQSIVAVAQSQFDVIVRQSVVAGQGALIVAELSPTEVRLRHLFDLEKRCFLSRPRDLSHNSEEEV